jgi:hypothetical protein
MTRMCINSFCGQIVKFSNAADGVCSYDWALMINTSLILYMLTATMSEAPLCYWVVDTAVSQWEQT